MSSSTALGNPPTPPPLYCPYQAGSAEFQLGLRPFKPPQWLLRDANSARIMRAKRARMTDAPSLFYKTLPVSIDAQRELHRRVTSHLVTHMPSEFHRSGNALRSVSDGMTFNLNDLDEPLLQLSAMIEEDFMLLQQLDDKMIITAACNAYSSSGRLAASVGHGMPWTHEPVPDLTERLGTRIERMLGTIHTDTPCERFNWLLTPLSAIFFHHDPHAHTALALEEVVTVLRDEPQRAGDLLWIRVERQTLVRLPETNAVAFSIHTYSDPLSCIATDTASLRGMLTLLQTYSPQRLQYSEMGPIKDFAVRWLESAINRVHS